ncbi:MAG: carboxylesterase family protein [Prevotella sp.]|nr:carboxylesterase family protein [Prevotella sp.]
MKKYLFFTIAAMMMALPSNAQLLRTTVAQGEIEGVEHEGHALFMNIPYAEAPVGDLRWKAPVAKKPWTGVYKADKWGARPPQPTDPNQKGNEIAMGEDCLYLSVETPAKSKDERLPVFVMIHGGGFTTGSYSGTQESFIREGIIYCSIEYRLGVLGFLAHPDLAKESPRGISGNYGIQDQIMALQWIHDNIAAFGGDPDKITIAGESAGGISVSMLCASPLCKGLFRGAISESGSSFWPVSDKRSGNTAMVTEKAAQQQGVEYQNKLKQKSIKQMRKLSYEELTKDIQMQMESFWPVVDNYAITDDQYKLYEAGNYNDVNVLIGTNSDEGSMFSRPTSVEEYEKRIRENYGEWADRLLKVYPAKDEKEVYFASSDIFRDGSFAWGTYAWANLQTKTGKGKVYMYYFDQDSENTILRSFRGGASHVAEMPFFYGYKFGSGKMTATEQQMEKIITNYIINFTKTGDPNGSHLPYWTIYEQGKPTVMIMREGLHLDNVPNQEQLDFFEEFFKSKRN